MILDILKNSITGSNYKLTNTTVNFMACYIDVVLHPGNVHALTYKCNLVYLITRISDYTCNIVD